MTHVALVIPTLDRLAGAERQVMQLARGLSRRDWRITVVALSGSGENAPAELAASGVEFLTLRMRKGLADPRGWLHFHRWLRREQPDILHAHLPHATWMARWSRRFAPVRVLVDTIHTSATGSTGRRLGYQISASLADHITTVSAGVADAYTTARMIPPARTSVIPNGVDLHHWRPDPAMRAEMRRTLGLNDEFLWFSAGRLDLVKDYPALLWAMMAVPVPARLIIAGAGPSETELRQISYRYGLESCVRFLGFQPDVRPWMQAADAFVLSSRWEGLPMCLLEAGACALPAVATDVPGSSEIILPGQTGYLAAPGSSPALRSAMTRMMRLTPSQRAAMGQQARLRICERFSLDTVLDGWETLYRELLDACPVPARRASPR
jgi:glycosyltransferase involved in cell wall biosynthesis